MNHGLLIKNAQIITLDQELGDFDKAAIYIRDGKIEAIHSELHVDDCEVIDASDMVVLPGFVDTHRHTWQGQLRGIATDSTLLEYMQLMHGTIGDNVHCIGAAYRPQDVYIGNLLGALEAINAGVTTFLDWSHIINCPESSDAAIQGLQEAGSRAIFAHGFSQLHGHLLDDAKRVRQHYFSSDSGLLTMALAIRGPEMSSLDTVRKEIELARTLGLRISMHVVGGGSIQPIEVLHEASLLGPDMNYVHCNALTDREFALIAASGGSVSITPEVEMQMGMGFPATGKAIKHGLFPSLGVDIVTATGGDLLTQMRMALQMERALQNEMQLREGRMPQTLNLTTQDALEWATLGGARALGLEKQIGSLKPGKWADLIFIRTSDINLTPLSNPAGSVVLHSHAGNVDSVFVGGKALKRHGKLLNVDYAKVRRLAEESQCAILSQL